MAQTLSPQAPKHPVTLTKHQHDRIDDYFWMKNRDSKEVLDYLNTENVWAHNYFEPLKDGISKLMQEFEGRIDPNELSAPFILNHQTYQYRSQQGKDYQQVLKISNGKPEVFLDENERAKGHSFYELADWSLSSDEKLLALVEDFVGRRQYEVRFKDQKKGTFLKDILKDVSGNVVWSADGKFIYYGKKDPETLREYLVYRHTLGQKQSDDRLIYEEKDERFSAYISRSDDKQTLKINSVSSTTSEVFFVNLEDMNGLVWPTLGRVQDHIYDVESHGGLHYILTNLNAKNNKLLVATSFGLDWQQSAKELMPHDEAVLIEGFQLFKTYILAEVRETGLGKLVCLDLKPFKTREILLPEETYSIGMGMNDDFEGDFFFYNYTSLTTPGSVYKVDLKDLKTTLWHQKQLIDPNFSANNYKSERIWVTANDGTKIPVCLVYKNGIDLKKAPMLLYAYGSYGYTIPDVFSPTRLSLLDRGFVFAVAHIRGSKYLGETWYQDGKLLKKINTFTDFINAAQYLGQQGYCDPDRIYANGGSAGGLLMGAVANMAPYLFKGIISEVPFVDVVSTMLDETIPLTTGEYEEWGNPNDKTFYDYMLSYSPYDNLRRMNYPAMYITTGYHDSQVQYWEPAKYVAKLRALKTDQNPLIFDCNMDAGHGGGSGRTNERMERAKLFAFILNLENKLP